jgi:hypothetical protein
MSCGGRVTKGGGMVVSIPFDATDVENLVVSVYTNGEDKVEKSGDDITVGEGYIFVQMSKTDVDVLADGVLSYTLNYEMDGVEYAASSQTTNFIKTPKDYSATSVTDLVQSAYTEGHAEGKQEGEEVGYDEAVSDIRNQSISLSVTANGTYTANTEDSIYFNEVNVNVPQGSGGTCNLQSGNLSLPPEGVGIWTLYPEEGYDGFSYFQVVDNGYAESYWEQGYGSGFESGYTAGQADCSGGTSCDLTETWIDLMEGDDFEGQGVDYYVSAITPNYDGWYKVHIQDKDYGYSKYQEGYADGQSECSGGTCTLENNYEVYLTGTETAGQFPIVPDAGYDGVANGTIYYTEAYQAKFDEGYREFQNGLTSFSFGPEQVVANGQGSFTYTNASGWSSVTIGMPLVYSCRVIFANISSLHNILSASDVTDIRFGYDALTQSEVIVGYNNIVIYGTPAYSYGRFEGISFAIPTSIFNQISSWDAASLSLNGYKGHLNDYIGGILLYPYRTNTWQSGDKTFISVSTFNFSD